MNPPSSEVRYFDTRSTRRRWLIGAAAVVVVGAGVAAVAVGTDVFSGNDATAGSRTSVVLDDPATQIDEAAAAAEAGADVRWTNVAMVGDSITAGSQAAIEEVLGARGFTTITIDGEPSRRIDIGNGTSEPLSGVKALYQLLADGVAPDVWVIALGTNDVGQYATAEEYGALIDELLAMLPADAPLVWVDAYRPQYPEENRTFNDVLNQRIADRGHAAVASWFTVASGNAGAILQGDQIHPNDEGVVAFANVVYAGMQDAAEEIAAG